MDVASIISEYIYGCWTLGDARAKIQDCVSLSLCAVQDTSCLTSFFVVETLLRNRIAMMSKGVSANGLMTQFGSVCICILDSLKSMYTFFQWKVYRLFLQDLCLEHSPINNVQRVIRIHFYFTHYIEPLLLAPSVVSIMRLIYICGDNIFYPYDKKKCTQRINNKWLYIYNPPFTFPKAPFTTFAAPNFWEFP